MRIKGLPAPPLRGGATASIGSVRTLHWSARFLSAIAGQSARSTMEMPGSGTTNFPPSAK